MTLPPGCPGVPSGPADRVRAPGQQLRPGQVAKHDREATSIENELDRLNGNDGDVRPGEGRKFGSLTLVLERNNPRFPWEPSTTMLTYRLTGTTGAFVVQPGRTSPCSSPTRS